MNDIERAYIDGFIKAATQYGSPTPHLPGVKPSISIPPIKPSIPNIQGVNKPNVNIPAQSLPSKRLNPPFNEFPITQGANTNYNMNAIGPYVRSFNNTPPNTVDVNAHGGALYNDELYEKPKGSDHSLTSLLGVDSNHHEPSSTYGYKADDRAIMSMPDSNINTNSINEMDNPFTVEDIAKRIGSHTNDIYNYRSLGCNGGHCYIPTNTNPNNVIEGYNTPAYLRHYFPNLTNAIIQPPGTYGVQIPPNADSPDKMKNIVDRSIKLDQILEPNRSSAYAKSSPLHQYNLQGGTNWVDKGEYYGY